MNTLYYASGERVLIGDIVDVDQGRGPKCKVVVIIPTGEAAEGFNASEWAYLGAGVMLQDTKVFGLLHLPRLDQEHVLVCRAQPHVATTSGPELPMANDRFRVG